MVLVNYATKEIVAKIVYYGPGLCGKTTNLQHIYTRLNPKKRGKMISLATEADRTLFFDFLPVELGIVQGFKVRFQLYTVPGQVFYSATRKLVLKGADAIVFVADSQADVLAKNLESIEDMKTNLLENDLDPDSIPIVFQYNKRDLDNIVEVGFLEKKINHRHAPCFESSAVTGMGVMESFKEITNLLIKDLKKKHTLMDTDTLRELPADVFERKEEKTPAEEAEDIPIEAVLEVGSGIHEEGAEDDVIAGELLDQIETIALADTVQAEAFFDNVRKGTPAEEARQKAENIGKGGPDADIEADIVAEVRQPISEEHEFSPEDFGGSRAGSGGETYLGLDLTSEEMMESQGVVSGPDDLSQSGVREFLRMKAQQGPVQPEAPQSPEPKKVQALPPVPPRQPVKAEHPGGEVKKAAAVIEPAAPPPAPKEVDLSPVIAAIEMLRGEVGALKEAVLNQGLKAAGGKEELAGIRARLEEIENKIKKTAEGQDHLLLSLLDAARDANKKNTDAHDKLDDGIGELLKRLSGDIAKKKWF